MNKPSQKPLPLWLKICLGGIILLGCWWRIEALAQRDWNVDELNQYNTGLGSLKPFWTLFFYCEAHSFPGDYLLTYPFVNIFKLSDKWGLAIPHAVTALLGFYVLWLLCRRYFKSPAAWLITFSIFALHRELIYHALELRPYSLLTTLGLSTFYILDSLVRPAPVSVFKSILWWLVLVLTIVYHPYGFFMIMFCGLFLILRDWRRPEFWASLQRRWVFWVSLALVGVPLWLYYIQGNPQNAPQTMKTHHIEVFQYIPNPLVNLVGFLKSVLGNLMGSKPAYLLSLGVLISLIWPKRGNLELWGFVVVLLMLPIMMLLVSDSAFQYWFIQRQYVWVMALFAFFAGLCWDDLLNNFSFGEQK